MKYLIIFFIPIIVFSQRIANHQMTNFNVNTSINKVSFDIYSKSTGGSSIRVGNTSYYINFNSSGLSSPVLSNINTKYTSNSPTGDYNEMTVTTVSGNKVSVTISFSGNGEGTGDLLLSTGTDGELICTVTLNIINSTQTSGISWDEVNSAMLTPTLQAITNNYSGSNNSALPVELNSFYAINEIQAVKIFWTTATEVNNYGFDIERDNEIKSNWQKIGFVHGHGNSNSPKEYYFTDSNPPSGKLIYRLKQIDFDGKFEYSKVVHINVETPRAYFIEQNYPNPFNPSTQIQFGLPSDSKVQINVYNILGEKVNTLADQFYSAGIQTIHFNANDLSNGVYIYSITAISNEGKIFRDTKKMLLVK